MTKRRYKLFSLKSIPTDNFLMTPLELKEYIDFDIKRIYLISHPHGEMKTGNHTHISKEKELFIMAAGKCIIVVDDGHGLEEIELKGVNSAIYLPSLVWHHFKDMSQDAVIVGVSSTNYDPERKDYIEDYQEFQKKLKEKGLSSN